MKAPDCRRAYTLTEFLVVIFILALLLGLLLPVMRRGHPETRQNTCRNNLRNLALAAIQFEKSRQQYPGYANELHPDNETAFTRRSWIFMLLPYLERSDIYDNCQEAGSSEPMVQLDLARCPSQTPDKDVPWPPCSYVCNSGLPDYDIQPGSPIPADFAANGVFHDHREYLSLDGVGHPAKRVPITRVSSDYIVQGDGTSNTILLTENVDALSWILVGDGTGGPANPRFERQVGCTWSDQVANGVARPPDECLLNSRFGSDPTFIKPRFARPSSVHPHVVNVAFCDGHVRAISDDIDYVIYCLLMTPRDAATQKTDGSQPPALEDEIFRTTPLDESKIR